MKMQYLFSEAFIENEMGVNMFTFANKFCLTTIFQNFCKLYESIQDRFEGSPFYKRILVKKHLSEKEKSLG